MVETKTYAEALETEAIERTEAVGVLFDEEEFRNGAAWDRAWIIAWLRAQADVIERMWQQNGLDEQAISHTIALRILAADLEGLGE